MTPREFFDLVREMRRAQRKYWRMKITNHLQAARKLEQKVDDEIARVEEIERGHPKNDLFM